MIILFDTTGIVKVMVISLFILTKQVKSCKNLGLKMMKEICEASSKQSWAVTMLFSKNKPAWVPLH